jgi:hypothetical protein
VTSCATRRDLLIGLGVAAAGGVVPGSPAHTAPITVEQFRQLSARLMGVPLGNLDRDAAARLLNAFLANGLETSLALLAADTAVNTGTVADDIVAAWYSGVFQTPRGEVVATFTDALMWSALDYTKPFGFCGGAMGYWALPPQT